MTLDVEALLEALVERVAAKLRTTPGDGTARLLTVQGAAAYLGRSKASVHRLIANRTLPCVRADRRVFIDRHDLERFISLHKH